MGWRCRPSTCGRGATYSSGGASVDVCGESKGRGLSHQWPSGQSPTTSIWVVTARESTLINDGMDAFMPSAAEMVASVVLLTTALSNSTSSVVMPTMA